MNCNHYSNGAALDSDAASVLLDDLTHEPKAYPCACGIGAVDAPIIFFKKMFCVVRADVRPLVANLDNNFGMLFFDINGYGRIGR